MAKRRIPNIFWNPSLRRSFDAMRRTAMRAGSKAMKQAMNSAPGMRPFTATKRTPAPEWTAGIAIGAAGPRRYFLYEPPGVRRSERLPLVVMLHGCGQDAEALAAISRMNRIAARERFFVLYPEQDRLSNAQGCWNWYDTRSGRAQGEAGIIDAAIDQVCLWHPIDPNRIALAGLSAGASMAALLATRRPERFRAIAMHSGIAPGVAHSPASALGAMRGRRAAVAHTQVDGATALPALLVIHGNADRVVAPANGVEALRRWTAQAGARADSPRRVQRGTRYAATITDYRIEGRLVATLCAVHGLGHAWSGGLADHTYSDPHGPDASRMIWSFVKRQFARADLEARTPRARASASAR